MENGTRHWSSLVYLFLAGSAAGVSAGLLLAPQSGKATREAMRRKLQSSGTYARHLRERVTHQSAGIRERAARSLSSAAARISPTNGQAHPAASA
jgi:gas vesicle protein